LAFLDTYIGIKFSCFLVVFISGLKNHKVWRW